MSDFRTILLLCALSVSGCTSLPSLEKVGTVSLRTNFPSYRGLAVDVDGNPDTRPGRMALEGFEVAGECDLCIFLTPVSVPLYAAIGAVITATETLPEEQAHELNRVTANVTAGLNLDASFEKAMREEASRQGIVLSRGYADATLNVAMTRFQWDVSVGNNVSIRIDFEARAFVNGKEGHQTITYRSKRASVPTWVADSGKPIRQTLTTIMDEASQTIWQQVLKQTD